MRRGSTHWLVLLHWHFLQPYRPTLKQINGVDKNARDFNPPAFYYAAGLFNNPLVEAQTSL